ncbi:MAG: class I SAM-dependent methyltransferase [Desulfocucumaceae bacterium]
MIIPERPARAVHWARTFIGPALKNGARAVDATAGNGYDTLFLAERVGLEGKVYAFDIQAQALKNTEKLIIHAGLENRVQLFQNGHQNMDRFIIGQVDAVMFNLGYLPGSDRSVTTEPETTGEGMLAALKILKPGGRLSIIVYIGHPGSKTEAGAVENILAGIEEKYFSVQKMVFWNSRKESPELYFITKAGEKND